MLRACSDPSALLTTADIQQGGPVTLQVGHQAVQERALYQTVIRCDLFRRASPAIETTCGQVVQAPVSVAPVSNGK